MVEAAKRQARTKLVAEILLTDGNNTGGTPPLIAAQQLRGQQVPVVAVGFGLETAGSTSSDVAVRELTAGPTVFMKQELQVTGALNVRGFYNQPIEVELYAEGEASPVDKITVRAKEGQTALPIRGLKWTPKKEGETKLSLRAKPKDGELLTGNNELSTFVTVLGGGIRVLFLQASRFSWESRFLTRSLDASDRISVDLRVVRQAGEIKDDELTPGQYDAIILGDVPAEFLTPLQQRLLYTSVERGAGLIMLGGRRSFGVGGWANTPIADLLPVKIHPGDGQIEPGEKGIKVVPNTTGLENYVTRLALDRAETARLWATLPPISGANRFSGPKSNAMVLATSPAPGSDPLMIGADFAKGRVLAFAGETWPWARVSDETRAAHRRLWRQSILWLTHREEQEGSQVQISLDRRRVAQGDKLELTVSATDKKGEPITDVKYQVRVEPATAGGKPESVEVFNQGRESRGPYFATGQAGDYRATVVGTKDGKEIGTARARFLVFQDDRELENPAADLALLRQIAETTGGQSLAPEKLDDFLKTLKSEVTSEYFTQKEERIWDNWPFFLAFVAVLTMEWFVRKRHGWV